MSKHTKGPWHVVLSNNATAHVRHENCHDVSDIGDLAGRICVMPAEITHSYNSLANARLIAAAPELLEALESLRSVFFDRRDALEEFERLGDLYYRETGRLRPGKSDPLADSNDPENVAQYEEWSRKRTYAALDMAKTAIAKATGEKA